MKRNLDGRRRAAVFTPAALMAAALVIALFAAGILPRCARASESGSGTDSGQAADSSAAGGSDALTNYLVGWPEMGEIHEASGVVMDCDNFGILYSLNRDTVRYPASTTKILTCLLVIENAEMDDTVTMSEVGTAEVMNGSTNAGTVVGEEFTVEQCLYMMMLKSANDIADELAVHVAGSISAFADMMNQRAAGIGCGNTHFVNPSGMPDSEHYTTAGDMALIMRECLQNETFRRIISTESYTVPPTNKNPEARVYTNHCRLILDGDEYEYPYCIGGKTGFTKAAWRTLVTAAEKDGRTLVCVTMRGPDKSDFTDAKNLFEYAFNNFSKIEIAGGSVNLPADVSMNSLTYEDTEESGGAVRRTYLYGTVPVGTARLTADQAAGTGANGIVTAGNAGAESDGSHEALLAGGPRGLLVAAGAFVAVAAAAIVIGYARPGRGKKKKHGRRRKK